MYTEVTLSEFLIRARLKIGELSEEIKAKVQYGDDADELIQDSVDLRIFLNAVNNTFNDWNEFQLYKRIEYMAQRYKLGDNSTYSKDWLDKFKPISTIVVEQATTIAVPEGTGFLYLENKKASLVNSVKRSIDELL